MEVQQEFTYVCGRGHTLHDEEEDDDKEYIFMSFDAPAMPSRDSIIVQ